MRLEDEENTCITDRVIKAEGKNATAAIVANIADIMRYNHAFRKYTVVDSLFIFRKIIC